MTKAEFDNNFKMNDLEWIAKEYEEGDIPHKPVRREIYNDKLKFYLSKGLVTNAQYKSWCIPDSDGDYKILVMKTTLT